MIKVIAFDFGEVLGPDADAFSTNFKYLLKSTGLTPEELQSIFNKHWPDLKIGRKKTLTFWQDVSKKSKNSISPRELENYYLENIAIYPKVFKLAEDLYKRGFILVLLSNETKEWMDFKIRKFKEFGIFTKIYCSAYIKVGKPDKEIFTYVLKDLNIKPPELLFIDNQENNISVTSKMGINSILFKTPGNLKSEINKILDQSS
ncbi:HAD-IA family hydrolase [Candidatus Woesebacteria bacterium]|nr:HAD-IA family hydrolase [Candidatus Woesebacteria bacterium]